MLLVVHREIKILRLFMHPHIIRLYEVIDSPEDVYVITEYAPVSIDAALKETELCGFEVWRIV